MAYRIFGKKKVAPPAPEIGDVTKGMEDRYNTIEGKIDALDQKLIKLKQQITAAKTSGAKATLQKRAMGLLKQKKMYQGQLDQVGAQQLNLEGAAFMTEQMKDTADQVAAMKQVQQTMKVQMQAVGIDDVEDLQDQMQEMFYDHEEMQEIMGRSFAVEDVDEDELLGELDLIEDEMAIEAATAAPAAPTFLEEPEMGLPAAPQGQVHLPQALNS